MSGRNPFLAFSAVGGAIVALGFMVAEGAASHPIGEQIPTQKLDLRREGAQGESVKAGVKRPEEAAEQVDVKIKGGDKGMKEVS